MALTNLNFHRVGKMIYQKQTDSPTEILKRIFTVVENRLRGVAKVVEITYWWGDDISRTHTARTAPQSDHCFDIQNIYLGWLRCNSGGIYQSKLFLCKRKKPVRGCWQIFSCRKFIRSLFGRSWEPRPRRVKQNAKPLNTLTSNLENQ